MNSEQCFEAYLALHLGKMCLCLVLHFTLLLSGFCYLQLQPDLLIYALHRKKGKKPQTSHFQTAEGSDTISTNIWWHTVKSEQLNSKKNLPRLSSFKGHGLNLQPSRSSSATA